MQQEEHSCVIGFTQVQILALSSPSCMILGKLLNFSYLQYPDL